MPSCATSRPPRRIKADEVGALREQTLGDGFAALCAAAADLRACFDAGGRLLASATAARPPTRWTRSRTSPARRPPAVALAPGARPHGRHGDHHRHRQRHRHRGDLLAPGHRLRAPRRRPARALDERQLAQRARGAGEARRRGLRTIALVGYDGGRVASEALADHVVVTRSQHIPRIQEAQATAYHLLRELVES
jgi:D-sedoheptulose 7-phosphate isomerase